MKIRRRIAVAALLLDIVLALAIVMFFESKAIVLLLLAITTALAFFSFYGPRILLKTLAPELSDANVEILSKTVLHYSDNS